MKISNSFPPNYDLIKLVLKPNPEAIFCYGDTIYNPSKRELTDDVLLHEEIHSRQQNQVGSPEIWYTRYLQDKHFRLTQEIEAYGEQYHFAKKYVKNYILNAWLLENLAKALSSEDYGKMISYGSAVSKIRNHKKVNA